MSRDHRLPRGSCVPSSIRTTVLALLTVGIACSLCPAQGTDFNAYDEPVAAYMQRLYDEGERELAFRPDYPGGFTAWQQDARAALLAKLGIDKIAASAAEHRPRVELGQVEDLGDFTRQPGVIETEPNVRVPFWLLKPKGEGPWPLGVFPHGHDGRGHDTTAGVYADEAHEKKSIAEDRDVAVQAVRLGFVAIAPAVRGLAVDGVPDLHGRHGNRDCAAMSCTACSPVAQPQPSGSGICSGLWIGL
jgi:hypothetical protein